MSFYHNAPKIGVFYDGNFLLHASNYYNYIHPQRRRLSINGLHDFISQRVAEEEGLDPKRCRICEAHYFRGRLNASDAAQRGSQLYHDRVFDDILISSEEHVRKPGKEFFARALDRAGTTADRTVMVGNDEDNDILGARHAGIDGVYLRTGISPYSDPMESQAAVLSLKGADYEGLANFLLV